MHITEELRMRVQALEHLIRSGLTVDPDQATFMATETVHQATRAAQSGSQDATDALAQLTRGSMGTGVTGMTSEAQSSLLMDVLKQVSARWWRKIDSANNDSFPATVNWETLMRLVRSRRKVKELGLLSLRRYHWGELCYSASSQVR